MSENVQVSFDANYKLRILDSQKFDQAETLDKECSTFMESKLKFLIFSSHFGLNTCLSDMRIYLDLINIVI